tara:strand:- start:62 stop:247 length:186 start_codon:yes stop_codon:yes gene_type:complete
MERKYMTADSYLLFLTHYANLNKALENAKDADMKLIWQNKIEQLVNKEKYERRIQGARNVH